LLRKLPPLDAVLRGSLIERYKRCGKPGCKCADGPGHGPKYYLSVSFPGERPQMDYVPQENLDATRALAWISTSLNYPKTKAVFAGHAVNTSGKSFHQGTVTGTFSKPEASTIGR
jgi:hypothetical protein